MGNTSIRGRYKMQKNRFFLVFLSVCLCYQAHAQSYESQGFFKISATRFSLPENHTGLTDPAFIIWGKFTKTSIGDKYYLYLRVRFEHSTANNPNPSFWYSYKNHNGKIYTDKEIGTAPFQSIRFLGASFDFKVTYGINTVNITMNHDDYKRMGEVPKDFDINRASVFVGDLVWYNHEATAVRNAIATYENAIKKKEEEAKKAKKEEETKQQEEAQQLAEEQELLNAQEKKQTNDDKDTITEDVDDFWSDSRSRTSTRTTKDENLRSASQFGGGLDDIEEGGYFKDDKGNFSCLCYEFFRLLKTAIRKTPFKKAWTWQVDTIRQKLLKIGGALKKTKRRVYYRLSSAFVYRDLLEHLLRV